MKKKLYTGRLLIFVITLLLMAIVIVIFVSISQSEDIDDTARRVSRTEKILLHSEKLIKAVLDNETGARGYVITGQKTFQEPLIKSKNQLFIELGQLKTLTADNPIQQTHIDSLYYYIDKRVAISEQMLVAFEDKGPAAAKAIVVYGLDKLYTDNVRVLIDKIQDTENILLNQRRRVNEKKLSALNKILLWVILFTILLLVVFIRKVWVDFIQKKAVAIEMEKLNQELEERVAERTGELLKSKNSVEEILLRIDDGFISLDKNWCYTYINKAAGELIHQNPESLIGKNVWEVFPSAVGSDTYNIFHTVMADKQYQWNEDYYEPLDLWQENHVYPAGDGISVFIRDITGRKRREREMEESNQRFQFVTKATSDAIWDWNMVADGMYWGAGMQTIFGFELTKLADNNFFWREHIHPEDSGRVLKNLYQVTHGTEDKWMDEYRFLKADNTYAYVADRGFVIRNEKGQAIRMVGAMQDISKRKEEENRLKLLELFIASASDAVVITEAEPFNEPGPRIVYVNKAFTQMTGYTAADVIGKSPRILQGPKSDKVELKRLGEAIRNWEPCEITTINYKKSGEAFWVNLSVKPVADEKGWFTHLIAIERDVTESKNEEFQKKLIAEVGQVFLEPAALKEKLSKVLNKIAGFGSFIIAEVWLTDAGKKQIDLAAAFTETPVTALFYENSAEVTSLKKGEGLPGVTWQSGTSQYFNNLKLQEKFLRKDAGKEAGLKSVQTFPLLYQHKVIGVLLLGVDNDHVWHYNYNSIFENLCSQLSAEIKRNQLEQELNQVFTFAPDIICMANKEGYFTKINPAASELLGYSQQELLSVPFIEFVHPDEKENTIKATGKLLTGNTTLQFENRFVTKTGKVKWLSWSSTPSPEGHVFAVAKDITEKKSLEDNLDKATTLARIGSWEVDLVNNTAYFSKITKAIHEVDDDFVPTVETGINFYKEGINRDTISAVLERTIATGNSWDVELQIVTTSGKDLWVRVIGQVEMNNGKPVHLFGTCQDIDARKNAELSVINVLEEKANILESIGDAFYTLDKNWIVTYWNKIAEKEMNKASAEITGKNIWEVFPEAKERPAYKYYHLALSENTAQRFETFMDGTGVWYEVSAYPSSHGLSVYFKNITARKLSEIHLNFLNESLQKQSNELAISNKELEQYAFVASHDLQEPLRMVTSFLTKLEMKYGDTLDEKGKQYIGFAVNGAKHMRQIILDLLDFSLVGKVEEDWEEIDLNALISEILSFQHEVITEKKAQINKENLPVLKIQKAPLRQAFQNLINNGLKYQRKGITPQITITAKDLNTHWQFSIADNGIGIEPEYFDKIFIIFQRLHNKDEYSGSGIGLAITKKIVEKMGGVIWVESAEGRGSTFYFTILKH